VRGVSTYISGSGRWTVWKDVQFWRLEDTEGAPFAATTMSACKAEAHRRFYQELRAQEGS
jgi:hypothetical protein